MKCKKHPFDLSSAVGVCASCLRERLFVLIAAQAQEDRRKSDVLPPPPLPPPLIFPRSVSPYIARRKSDNNAAAAAWPPQHCLQHSLSGSRFYSTPQVGPNGVILPSNPYKKKHSKFSLLSNLFGSKSQKPDSDHRVSVSLSDSREPCTASSSSPSWFSTILGAGRRKKQSRTFSVDESTTGGPRRSCRNHDRGMSPARFSEDEEWHGGSSGYSSESSQGWRLTPGRAVPPPRRGGGAGRPCHSRNVSGLTFCLSPLVRASPSRHWNQKGMPPDIVLSGELRVPVKSHGATATSFCKSRSRKLADFGRFNQNH